MSLALTWVRGVSGGYISTKTTFKFSLNLTSYQNVNIVFFFNLLLSWNLSAYAVLLPSVAFISASFFPKGVQ